MTAAVRARIRLALVDASGFIATAARALGVGRHWLHRYLVRMGLLPLVVEWRSRCPQRGRPRLENTKRREQWRRSKDKARDKKRAAKGMAI